MKARKARAQAVVARLLGRLLLALALVAGIAAMHTAIVIPMAASAHEAGMVAVSPVGVYLSGPEVVVKMSPVSSPVAAVMAGPAAETLMDSMNHDAMHACLFLLIAAALLLLLPAFGDKLPIRVPRLTPVSRQEFAVRGIDRTLALQVLRI